MLELNQQKQHMTPPESKLVVFIKENLNNYGAGAWDDLSIYRIPQILLDNDKKAYIPRTVSLGPYHHGCTHLHGMERHKWRALRHILQRHYQPNNVRDFEGCLDQLIEPYLDVLRNVKVRARAFYEGPIDLDSDEFVRMLLLDSCFALELFRGANAFEGFPGLGYCDNDPIFACSDAIEFIKRDMIMLENQIPLFVLDLIHRIEYPHHGASTVARLALSFFGSLMPTPIFDSLKEQKGLHCLDVLWRHLVSHVQQVSPEQDEVKDARDVAQVCLQVSPEPGEVKDAGDVAQECQQMIHCVTELKEAGIKFKKKEFKNKERVILWDIDFSNGILKMPFLDVTDGTKSLFLNLMAFEQCHLGCPNYITSYVVFMDKLIDSPADVSYLKHDGIIGNGLGSDAEVAELFNQLAREVVFDPRLMSSMSEKVNKYYNQRWHARWHAWRASLKHKYFSNPWSILSLIAAVVLLVLTFAQTLYSRHAYYAPPS